MFKYFQVVANSLVVDRSAVFPLLSAAVLSRRHTVQQDDPLFCHEVLELPPSPETEQQDLTNAQDDMNNLRRFSLAIVPSLSPILELNESGTPDRWAVEQPGDLLQVRIFLL